MTRQELESRYQLLRPLGTGAENTYLARARSGAIVMVHFLDENPLAWADGRLGRLDSLDPGKRERILDIVQVEGGGAVVTRFLMDFTSFERWLGVGDDPSARGVSELPPTLGDLPALSGGIPGQAAASGTGEGEITRMFRAQARDADVQGEPTGSEAAGEASAFATPEGEFTGTLRGPAHAPLAETPTAPPESGAHPETRAGGGDAPVSNEPGEFTRMFGAVSPKEAPAADSSPTVSPEPDAIAEASAPPPDASASNEPGEFTRMFRAANLEASPEADTPPAVSPEADVIAEADTPPADATTSDEPGEFARIFGAGAPPSDAPSSDGPGEFTRTFRAAKLEQTPGADSPPAAPPESDVAPEGGAPVPDTPDSAEPGEFTRMFRAARPEGAPIPDPPAEAPPELEAIPEPEASAPADAPARAEPGEFTRMFRAATPPDASAPETLQRGTVPQDTSSGGIPSKPIPAAPPPREPGEFTREFGSVPPPPAQQGEPVVGEGAHPSRNAPESPAPVTSGEPDKGAPAGEFTRLFEKLGPSAPAEPPPAPTRPTSPLFAPPAEAPDERYRERLFGGGAPSPPAHLRPSATPPVERPIVPVDPELPPLPSQMMPPPPPPPSPGGEYTRMISAYAPPPTPSPPAAGLPAASAPAIASPPAPQLPNPAGGTANRTPRIGLLVGLGSIALATVALILYLVVRSALLAPTGTEATSDSTAAAAAAPTEPAAPSP